MLLGAAMRNLMSNAVKYTHRAAAFLWAAGTKVQASGSTFTTTASGFRVDSFRRSSRHSHSSISCGEMASGLDYSLYVRRSDYLDIASRWLLIVLGDSAFLYWRRPSTLLVPRNDSLATIHKQPRQQQLIGPVGPTTGSP
jgi:hypothetical protein